MKIGDPLRGGGERIFFNKLAPPPPTTLRVGGRPGEAQRRFPSLRSLRKLNYKFQEIYIYIYLK